MTLRDNAYQDAVVDGKHARRQGKPRSANPHPGSPEGRGWNQGWHWQDEFNASGGTAGWRSRYEAKVLHDKFNMLVGRAAR